MTILVDATVALEVTASVSLALLISLKVFTLGCVFRRSPLFGILGSIMSAGGSSPAAIQRRQGWPSAETLRAAGYRGEGTVYNDTGFGGGLLEAQRRREGRQFLEQIREDV